MKHLKRFNSFSKSLLEKVVDTTGKVDPSVLNYWNGLYEKWINGSLSKDEQEDYERLTKAKLYYIHQDTTSDVYKKLTDWENKIEMVQKNREISLPKDNRLRTELGSGIKPLPKSFESQLTAMSPLYKTQKSKVGVISPSTEALHKFLNDEVEVPWQEIYKDLGQEVKTAPKEVSGWRAKLKNWFNRMSDDFSDRLEKISDWLFPEKTESEQYRELWKDRDLATKKRKFGL